MSDGTLVPLPYGNADHDSFSVDVIPYGVGDGPFDEEGFVFVYDHGVLSQQDFGFSLDDGEKVVVLMGMLFNRSSAVCGQICHGTVDYLPFGTEKPSCLEVDVVGWSDESLFHDLRR